MYRGEAEALGGLRSLEDAPPGWFARTGLRGDDEAHRLGFLALGSLAWKSSTARRFFELDGGGSGE